MAVNDKKEPTKVAPTKAEPTKVEPAKVEPMKADKPAAAAERSSRELGPWIAAIYAGGLFLVLCGERVVSSIDEARYALTGLGIAAMVVTTGMRFAAAGRHQGERRKVEQSLAKYSLGGLIALAIYFLTTDLGKGLLGIDTAAPATRARFESAATVAWVVLLLVSVIPLLFGERALFPMRRAEQIEGRRVQAATVSALTLVFAATYAALFTYAAGELDVKVDFSYFRTARPSDSTRNVAQSLTQPVKVTAFFPQLSEVGGEVEGYLRDLASASSSLEVEVQDRLLVPALAKEAKVTQDGVIVMTRGTSRESLTIGAEMKTAQAKLKSLDVDFQKALLKLMREQRTAYFTTGHGELNEAAAAGAEGRTSKGFKKLLETQNYAVKDLGLAQGSANEIPADAGLLIVLGPSRPLLDEEIAAIHRYAERGGKILMALDPDAKVDFNALAEAVDLTWKPAILAADKNFVPRRRNPSDRTNLVTNTFSSHASVSTLSKVGRAPVIFAGAAGLDKKAGTDAKVDFAVRALAETFADDNGNFEFDKATEKRSAYNLAAAVSRPVPGAGDGKDKQPPEMRAFVLGDADALSDGIIGVPPALVHEPNALLALDVMRWLGGEESFSGALSSTEDVRIEHTKQKDKLWFYGTIVLAPALVLGGGLWLTRRKRRLSPAAARRAAPGAPPPAAPRKGRSS